ncbi:Fe(3+) ABC transporter substrate-binding protein [Desulfomicrobium baculatum]|uniref:Extracellular solute-binding protein family 1 n=1 Tax=Desulfomicrobium baculatum (strain DSM 4028 / VKM B-1378 / X) TaxID=525897 RepID=C7LNH8_DESBD|nr:Fe(3+) ABC transporter substrate-binding protein [Desulfomicrobium baculatum]ACU88863.1 extracellular solute-binding protein family 1 [Desulfomicrobium baculatum DSM 4028]
MNKKIASLLTLALTLLTALPATASELVVYSARAEQLIKPLFDAYTAKTGVKIQYVTDKEPVLLERLKAEGERTPADMLITVDAGNLWLAGEAGVISPVQSETLAANIPDHLRDPGNKWFGLSLRARTIVYNTGKVKPADLSTYAALAGPEWKGRLLLRTSKKVYNQSLVAALIAELGEAEAERVVAGWVANTPVAPFANDNQAMEAVAAGVGDVTIVNTYYFGKLMKEKPDAPLALFWPDQAGTGVHVNVSGAGITTHAKHREEAVKFLEWLSSGEAQSMFAALNMEYPANPSVPADSAVAAWGDFKASTLNVAKYGEYQTQAIKLMDRVGYK